MSDLPAVSGKQAIAAFQKAGFAVRSVKGSHHILKKSGYAYLLSVPVHSNRDLKPGTLRSLIRSADMTVEDFGKLLD